VFVIEYDDWRGVLKTDNQPPSLQAANTGNIVINTFGGHSIHALDTHVGTIDLMVWGLGQTGRWGVQKQRSGALDAEAGFQPKTTRLKPWIRGGYTWSSGDDNPVDNTHGTFFQLLPTPRPYARFPFFNMMNIEDIYGSMILRPDSKVTTGAISTLFASPVKTISGTPPVVSFSHGPLATQDVQHRVGGRSPIFMTQAWNIARIVN
jgi:hypothetical protein